MEFPIQKKYKKISQLLGNSQCCYIGIDDKDEIKLGTVIITKTEKTVVSVDRPTLNDDHNFVTASKYKLICSVTKAFEILDNCQGSATCVTYCGKAKIKLRSAIHDSSTGPIHGADLSELLMSPSFVKHVRNSKNDICPVCVIETDGGPDQNVRFIKMYWLSCDYSLNMILMH